MEHNTISYKVISFAGQLAIKGVEQILTLFIREKGNVPDPVDFAWTREIEKHTPIVLGELHGILADYKAIPNFDDLSPEQSRIIAGKKKWKSYMLYMYGARIDTNIAQCPHTDSLLQSIPGMRTAFFSILEPHTHITSHRGPYKGLLRYHLGLIIPSQKELCGITIGSTTCHWEVGKSLIFDDTIMHAAWNDSDETRVVLFVDFKRSYPFLINAFNDLMIGLIRRSPFIADIVSRVETGK